MKIALKPVVKSFLSSLNPFYVQLGSDNKTILRSIGVNAILQDTQSPHGQIYSYNYCPPLAGIIQRKARAFNNGRVFLMDKDGKESTTKEAKKLRDLMARPNVLQNWEQFSGQAYTFKEIFGEAFIFALKGIGSSEVSSMWVLPNWMVSVQYSGKLFYQSDVREIITKYIVSYGGSSIELTTADIIHIKDSVINSTDILRGQSRMVSLRDPISNIIAAYEARNVLITKRGSIGILSNNSSDVTGSVPLRQDEKDELQKDFQTYGLGKAQSQVIITSSNLQWQSMTFPTRDLMLFEEIEDDVRQIADNYEYPMYLLGFKAGTTFSNVGEAKKSLYQDAIIPDSESFYSALSQYFNTEKYGFSLKVFFDHLDILQKSEKDKAEAFKILNDGLKIAYEHKVISMEEYRLRLDMEEKIYGSTMYEGQPTPNIQANGN